MQKLYRHNRPVHTPSTPGSSSSAESTIDRRLGSTVFVQSTIPWKNDDNNPPGGRATMPEPRGYRAESKPSQSSTTLPSAVPSHPRRLYAGRDELSSERLGKFLRTRRDATASTGFTRPLTTLPRSPWGPRAARICVSGFASAELSASEPWPCPCRIPHAVGSWSRALDTQKRGDRRGSCWSWRVGARTPSDFAVASANGFKNCILAHSSCSHHLSITHHVTVSGHHSHPLFFFLLPLGSIGFLQIHAPATRS